MQTSPNKWIVVASVLTAIIVVSTALNIPGTPPSVISDNQTFVGQASLTLLSPVGPSIEVGQTETVRWASHNYAPKTVSVSLIRKVSDTPVRYELVRTIASSTKNDGVAIWVPAKTDVGDNLYLEIGCALSDNACYAGDSSSVMAVTDTGRFANTAASYQAIEQLNNR